MAVGKTLVLRKDTPIVGLGRSVAVEVSDLLIILLGKNSS
jgi:hypothetical protein